MVGDGVSVAVGVGATVGVDGAMLLMATAVLVGNRVGTLVGALMFTVAAGVPGIDAGDGAHATKPRMPSVMMTSRKEKLNIRLATQWE